MKNDKRTPSTSSENETPEITASGSSFSNHHQKSSLTLGLNETQKKTETPMKTLKEDATERDESTAHENSVTTPQQIHSPKIVVVPTANTPTATTPTANTPIKTAFSAESVISVKEPLPKKSHAYFSKVNENIDKIQVDQSKQTSWIRKLGKQKWISIFDTLLIGFTLIFFTFSSLFVFHVNPILEMKITPEFQSKVQSFLRKDNFKNCNHSSWLTTDISKPSIIDISRCYTKFEYGRVVYETFKSSTLNSSDNCNIDRVEVYPCYSKNATNDPLNIFWGVNGTTWRYICNGSENYDPTRTGTYAFNSLVQKYALIDKQMQSNLFNRIVFSAAFFFQCPKCDIIRRTSRPIGFPEDGFHYFFFEYNMTAPPIPNGARRCPQYFCSVHADLEDSRFVKNVKNSFSRQVFPFKIVEDKDFV